MTAPHVALVRQCLRATPEPASLVAAVEIAARIPDWDELFTFATWHQVEQLVAQVLHDPVVAPAVPSDVLTRTRRRADQRTIRTVHLMGHLDTALGALADATVEVMLLKGAALLDSVYPGFGVRTMADLDLLVREADLARAESTLRDLGFRSSQLHGGPAVVERMRREHRHLPTLVDDRGVAVEIHRYLEGAGGPAQAERVWGRARRSNRPAATAFLPSPEDLLLHLAVHFAGDRKWSNGGALRQVTDVAETIRSVGDRLDWDAVLGEAIAARQTAGLFFGLYAVREVVDPGLMPDDVLRACRPTGFSDRLGEQFIASRVLSSKGRVPVELLAPRRHPVRRLFLPRATAIERHHLDPSIRVPVRFYSGRLVRAAAGLGATVSNPRAVLREARLTRVIRGS